MARIIPLQPSSAAPSSERGVHAALAGLPDPWVVLADISIGLFGRPRPGMAQLDFLLIHPQRGLCVLEVKGGAIEVREGTWYTTPRGGPRAGQQIPLSRSPFVQAADQRYEMQRFLWKRLNVPDEAMAHAVALPDCIVDTGLGPDAPRSLIVDRRDVQSMEAAALRALTTWKTRLSLSESEVERLIELLKPSAELTVVLAAEVALTEEGLQRETRRQVHFTDSQFEAYEVMLRQQRVVVIGEAGTGKTVLAVERAKRLSQTGVRTLLLCHRGAVAAFMRTTIGSGARRRLDLSALDDLTVAPFGELLSVLAEDSGRKPPSTKVAISPDWLLGAAEDVGLQFDALVVDEAQEFTPDQLDALLLLLSDPDESPVYLFADPFQHSARFSGDQNYRSGRGSYNWRPPGDMPLVTLIDNVRNSEPISLAVGHFLAEQRSIARVTGPDPEVITCPNNEVIELGIQRVKKLLRAEGFGANQTLLVAVGLDKGAVTAAASKASLDVVDVNGLMRFPLPPADMRVAVGTPDDVQGLEAEVVIVLRSGNHMTVADVRDLYVAASRARSHLVIVGTIPLIELQATARAALALARRADDA